MKRISFMVSLVLVWTALVPFVPFTSAVSAMTGAGFTTVNTAVDGPGHCKNGNGLINCNIYDGKEYVWLNGGPSANRMGPDGSYFFAVLAPGMHRHPNDGGAGNLSDDYDGYANRSFTITKGKVSGYTGSHSYDRWRIRLFAYSNTPNTGGVYILAICSLGKGYPVKPSNCKYDQFKVKPRTPNCTPIDEVADFKKVGLGQSVQGLGVVAPDLNIQARHEAIHIAAGADPQIYAADPKNGVVNGGIDPNLDGFGDYQAHANLVAPHFTFTFAPGVTISHFTVRMLDFGDFNPTLATEHLVTMNAYDASSNVVGTPEFLSYTSNALLGPTTSSIYGNLQSSGDALKAQPGQPGNWTWDVSVQGIVRVDLEYGLGFDPNVGFDLLSFSGTKCR